MRARAFEAMALSVAMSGCIHDPSDAEPWDVPVPGSYQEYRATRAGGAPFVYRIQVVATSAAGFTRRATMPTTTARLESSYVVVDGSEYVAKTTSYAADGSVLSTTSYDPAFPVLSAEDSPGSTLTVGSTVASDGTTSQSTRSVRVDGIESVAVPAGVFTALKTTAQVTSSLTGESYDVVWWVRGIGRVKMMAYLASSPESGTTYELTGHGIAPVP